MLVVRSGQGQSAGCEESVRGGVLKVSRVGGFGQGKGVLV